MCTDIWKNNGGLRLADHGHGLFDAAMNSRCVHPLHTCQAHPVGSGKAPCRSFSRLPVRVPFGLAAPVLLKTHQTSRLGFGLAQLGLIP